VDLSHVLWIGGGPGSGSSSVARALAQRFALLLYAVDDHDEAHEPRMPAIGAGYPAPTSLGELVDRFVMTARHRFRLVLEDLAELPPSPPLAIVEGAQLFPTSVAAVLRDPGHALFLLPGPDAQPETVEAMVARRFTWEASDLRLTTLSGDVPLDEAIERAAAHFLPAISAAEDRSR
jgi:hypothetical protein